MRRTPLLAALVLVALSLGAAPPPPKAGPDWKAVCRKTLGGRRGAVAVVGFPSGTLLHTHNAALARKKFPGSSIFKPLAAYLLLRERAVRPDQVYRSHKRVLVERYGVTLSAPYDAEGAELDLAHALSESNNGYFYTYGQWLKMETWLTAYRQFGLGNCVRPPKTPHEKAEFPAHGGRCVLTSTMDLVPYLEHLAQDASPEMAAVRDAMRLAVEEGTGKPAAVPGVAVCGKTGWLSGAGRFLGFAPQKSPEIGVIVTLPGATGGDAAGVAGAVLRAWSEGRRVP